MICTGCGETKPEDQFGKWRRRCLSCRAAYARAWYAAHSEKLNSASRAWYAEHPEKSKASARAWYAAHPDYFRARRLLARYGLTPDAYEAMLVTQDNKCVACYRVFGKGMSGPVVDHNRVTKVLRELLCGYCNTAFGLVKEDPETLEALAAYARRHRMRVAS